jgi:hypothetical protein
MLRNRLAIITVAVLLVGCASSPPTERADMLDRPVDCATADVDVAVLKEAIPGTAERMAARVRLVIPVSRVAGRVTGDLDARREIASGRTEKDLRARIAEIEARCPAGSPASSG